MKVKPCYNEATYYRHKEKKVINLGAKTWACYIENCIIMRHNLMRLMGTANWERASHLALHAFL